MGMSSVFTGIMNFFKANFITRLTGVMIKGSLGHKVTVILGGLFIVYGVFKAFYWIILATAGYILIYLAFKDYERICDRKSEST